MKERGAFGNMGTGGACLTSLCFQTDSSWVIQPRANEFLQFMSILAMSWWPFWGFHAKLCECSNQLLVEKILLHEHSGYKLIIFLWFSEWFQWKFPQFLRSPITSQWQFCGFQATPPDYSSQESMHFFLLFEFSDHKLINDDSWMFRPRVIERFPLVEFFGHEQMIFSPNLSYLTWVV